jgi:hypothetical protein
LIVALIVAFALNWSAVQLRDVYSGASLGMLVGMLMWRGLYVRMRDTAACWQEMYSKVWVANTRRNVRVYREADEAELSLKERV